MTELLSRVTRACARIGALMNFVGSRARGKFVDSEKAAKLVQVSEKIRFERTPGRSLRRHSISRQARVAELKSASATSQEASELDVAGFCSELEAMRGTMASRSAERLERLESGDVTASIAVPSTKPEHALLCLEEDVTEAVRLLAAPRTVRHDDPTV